MAPDNLLLDNLAPDNLLLDNLAPDNLAPGQFGIGQFGTKIVNIAKGTTDIPYNCHFFYTDTIFGE